jgi:hypothetical protein
MDPVSSGHFFSSLFFCYFSISLFFCFPIPGRFGNPKNNTSTINNNKSFIFNELRLTTALASGYHLGMAAMRVGRLGRLLCGSLRGRRRSHRYTRCRGLRLGWGRAIATIAEEGHMARHTYKRIIGRAGVFDGMNRRDLDRIFLQLGGSIEFPRRTGEVLYRRPLMTRPARANARRKDASRHLVHFVREILGQVRASRAFLPATVASAQAA